MPERPEHLVVATSRRPVEIPWVVHDMVLARLVQFPAADGIAEKFELADTTGEVTLTPDEEAILHEVAEHWIHEVGFDRAPASVVELRDSLKDFFLVYSRGELEIEWDSRNLLLERLGTRRAAADIVTAITVAGPSHLRLADEQMAVLNDLVSEWLHEVGPAGLPPGIPELRNALEVHDQDVRLQKPGDSPA